MRLEDVLQHWLVRAALWVLFLVSFGLSVAFAQPQPPVLSVNGGGTRFEFAPVPELFFTRGIAETIQLGAFQLDPSNRWTPGDFTRASGWRSSRLTRLIDVATGQPATMFAYDGETAELSYAGTWSGDVTVRIEAGAVSSAPFRIRVLTPTVVWGNNAAAVDAARQWGASICEGISFGTCRGTKFKGGLTDVAPLVVFITAGLYGNQDWFLGSRRFVYVTGSATNPPTLVGDVLASTKFEVWQVRNLNQRNSRIGQAGARTDVASRLIISNVHQCCETLVRNGIVNPHSLTVQPWTITVWNFESVGMGDVGNTVHGIYAEGRPKSTLEILNSRWMGSRGSSSVKTTMQHVAIRHSLFSVSEVPGDLSQGLLTHTPVDVPSVSRLTVYGNEFQVWRGPTVGQPNGRTGVLAGTIFLRLRKPGLRGSDIPAYPNVSWNPPVTSQQSMSSPGPGWPAGPETYVNDAFWAAVTGTPLNSPANTLMFDNYIGYNHFKQLPGSLPVRVMRVDGTHPAEPTDQFGPGRPLRTHVNWVERSRSWLAGNTYEGFASTEPGALFNLDDSEQMVTPEPGAKWPRNKQCGAAPCWAPEDVYPKLYELEGELPLWFKL